VDAPHIVLTLDAPGRPARTWCTATRFRIGRLDDQEIKLDDAKVSRRHAEVFLADEGWVVRDLGSANGTHLNTARLGRTAQRVRQGDVIRVGDLTLRIESVRHRRTAVSLGSTVIEVEAVGLRNPDGTIESCPVEQPQTGGLREILLLVQAACRVPGLGAGDDELAKLLRGTVSAFGAQRAGIFLLDEDYSLTLGGVAVSSRGAASPRTLSRAAAILAVRRRQSLLFQSSDAAELQTPDSVRRGAVASVICALLWGQGRVVGILHLDRGEHAAAFTQEDLHLADTLAAALAAAVERSRVKEREEDTLTQTVTALAQAIEMRDRSTGDHTHRVTAYSLLVAEELGMPADQRRKLRISAALHDIGKLAIDDDILRKPDRLTDSETARMRTHATRGAEVIQTMPGLAWAVPVVRSHHERWDGCGYPDGLKTESIPLAARVVAVADAFDAMISDRPYRRGLTVDEAFGELRRGAGTQFDPRCVDAFFAVRNKIEAVLSEESHVPDNPVTLTETAPNLLSQIGVGCDTPLDNSLALFRVEARLPVSGSV
jgi:HD-GYP domain-containing protein (c-di-GMP phosphodiesterase class II)